MPRAKVYLTLPHNQPSGGVKVVNEFVQLFRSRGHEAYVCVPREHATPATFIRDPAPVMPLDEMARDSAGDDAVISTWHTEQEYRCTRDAKAAVKVFWQHGILVPTGPGSVGERVFEPGVFDQYWNVSHACGQFIKNKYRLETMYVVNPYFDPPLRVPEWSERSGGLVVARRGSEFIPRVRRAVEKAGQRLTVLSGRFDDQALEELLLKHRFFVSVDNGIKRPAWWRLRSRRRRRWVWHGRNLLGFPVTAAQAAACGCVVVGFAMGGGLEWMTAGNMYLARDDHAASLVSAVRRCLSSGEAEWRLMAQRANRAVSRFTRDHAWSQTVAAIGNILER